MIERVARAICKRRNTAQCAAICLSHLPTGYAVHGCPEVMTVWGEDARAAIAAMREPSNECLLAGQRPDADSMMRFYADANTSAGTYLTAKSMLRRWQRMIDAALEESK